MILMIQVFMAIACLIEMFATTWPQWMAAKMMNVSPPVLRVHHDKLNSLGFLRRYQSSHVDDLHLRDRTHPGGSTDV